MANDQSTVDTSPTPDPFVELADRLDSIEQRLAKLESAAPASAPSDDVEQRVAALETAFSVAGMSGKQPQVG